MVRMAFITRASSDRRPVSDRVYRTSASISRIMRLRAAEVGSAARKRASTSARVDRIAIRVLLFSQRATMNETGRRNRVLARAFLAATLCLTATPPLRADYRVTWLAEHAVRIRSIDAGDG